jgi:hypothetical protein
MAKKKKHINKGLSGFFRYLKGDMKNPERNAFERELQKDPFFEEAMEGLSSISPEDAERDLGELQAGLDRRTKGRRNYIFYRIAASVAVLLILSSVFILTQRKNLPDSSFTEKSVKPEIAQNEQQQDQKLKEHAPAEKYNPPDEVKSEAAGVKREQGETNPSAPATHQMKKSRAAVLNESDADNQMEAEKP